MAGALYERLDVSKYEKRPITFKDSVLLFEGFVIDQIDGLAVIPDNEFQDAPTQEGIQAQHEARAYNHEGYCEALWRSLVANRDGDGSLVPDNWASLLKLPRRGAFEAAELDIGLFGKNFQDFREANLDFRLGGNPLEDYFDPQPLSSGQEWSETPFVRLLNVLVGRWLITTKQGYIWMATDRAEQEDAVVIAFGTSMPMIMRFDDTAKQWKFIGEAYIHGLMEGEAIDMMEEGRFKVETFELS